LQDAEGKMEEAGFQNGQKHMTASEKAKFKCNCLYKNLSIRIKLATYAKPKI